MEGILVAFFLVLAVPVLAVSALLCAPALRVRSALVALAHTVVATVLLAAWGLGTIGLMVDCGSGSDAGTCAWVTALFLAGPVLLTAQFCIGLGSLRAKWPPVRWVGRLGSIVAVLGLFLLSYGWFGPAEAFLPPGPPR